MPAAIVSCARHGKLAVNDDLLTDLEERIRTYAVTAAAISRSSADPANGMWGYLLDIFSTHAADIDRHNLVSSDPMLLMGESCILSNECYFDWGGTTYDAGE